VQLCCLVPGRRVAGERAAAVVVVLVALLWALTGVPAAAAAGPARVTSTDALLVWDGSRETYAVRWHLSAPATRVDWLVATPDGARTVPVRPDALSAFADGAAPRDRWLVTHPWLLVGDEGDRARDHLAGALEPASGGVTTATTPESTEGTGSGGDSGADGTDAALRAAAAAGVPVDDATRQWAAAATLRGWQVRLVTVTLPRPATVVGPVALDLPVPTPVVPATAWPRGGALTLVTAAPTVLAPDQPDVALAGRSVPSLTVENARRVPRGLPVVADRAVPAGGWVVTALAGQQVSEATVLLPQGGAIGDWRTEVGVWWPGWGAAALTVVVLVLVVALGVVVSRRRARTTTRPPVAVRTAPAVVALPGAPAEPDTLTDLTAVTDGPDALVDTCPDLDPARAGLSSPSRAARS
jgi:hypothetical protein